MSVARPELRAFADADALAHHAAGWWLDELRANATDSRPHSVALAGGRIAERFFMAVTEQARARRASLASVHFFWGDERCVPPADADSNFASARKHLLEPLEIAANQVHRVAGEAPPELAVAEATEAMLRLLPRDATGTPVLDVIFLGLGEDGHVASLFPGDPVPAAGDRAVYRAVIGPKPPPQRVTVSYAVIGAAKHIRVLASGAGKAEALRASLSDHGQTPLAHVLRRRPDAVIWTDLAGADLRG